MPKSYRRIRTKISAFHTKACCRANFLGWKRADLNNIVEVGHILTCRVCTNCFILQSNRKFHFVRIQAKITFGNERA